MPITPRIAMRKIPKSYETFKKLLPSDGFCELEPSKFKEMMKIIHNEQDKNLKHIYFTQVLDKLFSNGWGWYGRLGQSLSGMRPIEHASQLPESKRNNGLKVLRMVKDMHIELRYSPSYIGIINGYIREFGGSANTLSRAIAQVQRAKKFNQARVALAVGQKVPRKLKKIVKSKLENTK